MYALIVVAIMFLPTPVRAFTLEIGARLPTMYGEVIVVRNDDGIKNWTNYFPYGSICHTDLNLKIWLIVRRIIGDRALVKVDLPKIETTRLSCPHGTETSMPLAQARKQYEDYARTLDDKVFSDVTGVRPKSGF